MAALVPAVVLFGRRPSDPGAAPGERQIERMLEATMDWSLSSVGVIRFHHGDTENTEMFFVSPW